MTSSSSNPRLICEGQECSETIYDGCHDCNKAFCCNCIDIHFCSGRSQTAGSSAELSTFNMASAETPTITKINLFFTPLASVTNPPPQTKAAFERNKKRAVAELLEEASERSLKYAPDDLKVPPSRFPLVVMAASAARSWVWDHFEKIVVATGTQAILNWANTHASCNLCHAKALADETIKWAVSYTSAHSPGHLERHLKCVHNKILINHRQEVSAAEEKGGKAIFSYFKKHPKFEELYLKWAVHTFQPLNTVEEPRFRAMCQSLSIDCPMLSKIKVINKLLQVEQNIKWIFKKVLKGQNVAITLDHWTSNATANYIAQTVHFISEDWKLYCFTLACSLHKGGTAGKNTQEIYALNLPSPTMRRHSVL